jgi:hypothetical protein
MGDSEFHFRNKSLRHETDVQKQIHKQTLVCWSGSNLVWRSRLGVIMIEGMVKTVKEMYIGQEKQISKSSNY